ncbi:DNA topology modulation protein [Neobacillus notoginsengisoli]|uniref:DNA topology modulation protein n=1 Tax=Neobacillus notoginsengisoli TaxID=1578198 RepID=A0A417YZ54_9BACI|nr:DNA topology modulation protein [Neobacillus notoginsengisoli]RHW43167.1 DNA topology modulation protein [Neobacillus notoginsengisoli]
MKRIMIIGSGGAGKSTLAKELGERLGIKVYHLDSLFWQPGWVPMERNKFIELQKEIMKKEEWIIDGNYSGTMELRLERADTVIFLHYSTIRCLYGIVKRRLEYHGKTRFDMGAGCPERLDWEFAMWVAGFNRMKAPKLLQKLQKYEEKKTFIFTRPSMVKTLFR